MPITIAQANDILGSVFPDWINQLGLRVDDIDDGTVRVVMPATAQVLRTGEMISGQASIALADTAIVIALANALGGFKPVGTVGLSFSFMRSMRKADVVCEASILKLGRSMAFCQAVVRESGSDKDAIHATGTYAIPPGTGPGTDEKIRHD